MIRRIISRYRSGKEDIDDLTQETFLKCFAAEMKQDIQDPQRFVFKVAKNVAISEAKRKRHATTDSIEDLGGMEVYVDEEQISAEDQLHSRQKLFALTRALAELPPEQGRALLMRKVEGLKFKQIAIRLDVSVSTVEKRVAAALIGCNNYLRQNGYDPADFGQMTPVKQNELGVATLISNNTNENDSNE